MTIKELAHHFYNKKEVDIDFCCLCSALLEFVDLKMGKMYKSILIYQMT